MQNKILLFKSSLSRCFFALKKGERCPNALPDEWLDGGRVEGETNGSREIKAIFRLLIHYSR